MPNIRFVNSSSQQDQCGCLCYNRNGLVVVLAAQLLMLLAAAFSSAALFDCQFVTVDAEYVDHELADIFENLFNKTVPVEENNEKRGLGFFFYEGVDGECTWDHFEDLSDRVSSSEWEHRFENGHDAYMDFLGSDWDAPRALAVTATVLSWCFLFWLATFSCVSHIKCLRWTFGVLLAAFMTALQGSTFAVLNSDLCDRYDCELGRSSRLGITALVLAVAAGLLMFFTRDHPGREVKVNVYATASVTEAHPHVDEETDHPHDNNFGVAGVTEIQEVEVMRDFDESLVDMTGKKSPVDSS